MSSLQQNLKVHLKLKFFMSRKFLGLHGYFSKSEHLAQKRTTYSSSLKFDAANEFTAKIETLKVNYASSEYLSSNSAIIPPA